jgi:molybdopterin-guanine dinucleotide biosynthesis protein A
MAYDAVILAGGESSSDLKKIAPYDSEALILIGKYPMIYYVYHALAASPLIDKIVISGPVDSLRSIFSREENICFVNGGNNAVESFAAAVEVLQEKGISEQVLILPTDIPFITTEAIEDFLAGCEKLGADFCYPVITKAVNEARFPGVVRTYVRLKEGIFTGGNLFLVRSQMIERSLDLAVKLVERRKNPIAMARLFGLGLVFKYLFRSLSIAAVEKRFYQTTGIKGRALISDYAEIGVDVDKPSDLLLAQEHLGEISF